MASQLITVEMLGVPGKYQGILDGFFSKIRSTIAEIWELEIKPEDVFIFPTYTNDKQGNEMRIFCRYGTTSSALLDLDWKQQVHGRIEKLVQEKFRAASVDQIE